MAEKKKDQHDKLVVGGSKPLVSGDKLVVSESKPLVSIVIPCYNSARTIEACLHSLFQQQTDGKYEVIVVDSSTDETPTLVREKFSDVKLIHLGQQTYPGAGRNIGVHQAQGNIIAFIDSDCVAAGNWLAQGLEATRSGYSIVGGSVQNANPGFISWPDYFLTFNEFLPTMPRKEIKFMPTCNFMITKQAFLQVGGFREDLLAGEDTLFCAAATRHHTLLFDPLMQVSHTNRENLKQFLHHHYTFGRHSAFVRKMAGKTGDLPGKSLAKYPWLALAAPLARSGRIAGRMLRHNQRFLVPFFLASPGIFVGTMAWSYGFISASLLNR